MKELRRKFNRFCFRNRDKGIPNLMLYVAVGGAVVALMNQIDPSYALYRLLCFDRALILQGQIWRLVTYPLCQTGSNLLLTALVLLCYYSLGRGIENIWGTLRFNLYYFGGILLTDLVAMLFSGYATASYLNMSLFLAYATLFPDAQFRLFYIIPVKAWVLALIDLATIVIGLVTNPFPTNLIPLVSLGNYFLFFGRDVLNVVPVSWRVNARRAFRKRKNTGKTIPFPSAGSYEATHATVKAPYTHRCTVCGRTDVSDPQLEFRYCSRCKGYYCYCEEHINNHSHIQ